MALLAKQQHMLEYTLVRMLSAAVAALPVSASLRFGSQLGSAAHTVLRSRTGLAHENLKRAFGDSLTEEERSRIIGNLFRLLGEAAVESIIFSPADISSCIHIDGMERVRSALDKNNGVIILVPHFGVWELASFVFGAHLNKASVIYKPLKNPYLDRHLIETRAKSNLTLIPSKNALRSVMKNLKSGHAVGILFDQNAGKNGVPVTFFGHTAYTYAAPAVFARKTRSPVLPAYMEKTPGRRNHRLVIGEPFPLIDTGDESDDLLANTQQYNDFLEGIVRRRPDHWFGWLHNRWKIPRKFSLHQQRNSDRTHTGLRDATPRQ